MSLQKLTRITKFDLLRVTYSISKVPPIRNYNKACENALKVTKECERRKFMSLPCKLAVITGGAAGIGLATANELLCHNANRVILIDCNCEEGNQAADNLNKKHGKNKACFVYVDVRHDQDLEDALKTITTRMGNIDILVNSAGYLDDRCAQSEIDINLKATIRSSLFGMKYLSLNKSNNAVIVNVASTLGIDIDTPYLPIFTATQHAIGGFTKSLGDDTHFKASGVRVIGILPAPTLTNLMVCQSDKAILPEWSPKVNATFYKDMQTPDTVARGIAFMIQYAPSASLWVVENNAIFETALPTVKKIRKRVIYV